MKLQRAVWISAVVAGAMGFAGIYAIFFRPVAMPVAVERKDATVQLFGLGTIEARVVSKVGLKVSGILTELAADQGDVVPKGTILARLDPREQEARLERASASVGQARANLTKAGAAVERARAVLTNAEKIQERRGALVKKGDVSIEAAETAQANKAMAAADLALALAEMEVARAALKDSEAEVRLESVALSQHLLTSPFDAKVVARHRELGAMLQAGEAVFTLVDANTVWALAYIDESRAGQLAVGQPAEVVLRSQPNVPVAGQVARIDIEADRINEERKVYIAFEHPRQAFHLGEQAEIHITVATLDRALTIPDIAVQEISGSRGKVWTIEDGRLSLREVALGYRLLSGEREIVQGVPVGAQVITRVSSGMRVGRPAVAILEAAR
jgi:HlyD family secretion protein